MAAHLTALGLDATRSGPPAYVPHPYQAELEAFEIPEQQLKTAPEQLYRPLEEVPCTYVDTVEALKVWCGPGGAAALVSDGKPLSLLVPGREAGASRSLCH